MYKSIETESPKYIIILRYQVYVIIMLISFLLYIISKLDI